MKYEGIDGETTQGDHKQWIELQSCQLGTSRQISTVTGASADREASYPIVSEVVVTKEQDAASSKLFEAALYGEAKKVTIDFVSTGNNVYMKVELENVLVSSYSVSGSGGQGVGRPMESIALNYLKITFTSFKMDQKGNAVGTPNRANYDIGKAAK